jgi:hypothetical protein
MSAVPVRFFSFGWNSGIGKIQSPWILILRKKPACQAGFLITQAVHRAIGDQVL